MKKLILMLLLAVQVYAADYYVALSSAGANDGSSWANAVSFASLRGNWDGIAAGTIVYIDGGTDSVFYNINGLSGSNGYSFNPQGTSGSPITVTKGVDAGHNGKVILRKNSTTGGIVGLDPSGASNTIIDNIDFQGKVTTISQTYLVFFYNSTITNLTFQYCTFRMFYSEGVGTNGSSEISDNIKFLHCDFLNLIDTGTNSGMDMMWLGGPNHTNWEIAYCNFINLNPKTGATVASSHRDLIQCEWNWGRGGTFKIHSNFFYDGSAGAAGACIESEHLEGDWEIYNNVFKSNSEGTNGSGFFGLLSLTAQTSATTSLKIYNNVFISTSSNDMVRTPSLYNWDTIEFINNIVYKASGEFWNGWHLTVNGGSLTFNYNLYSATNTSGIFQYGEGWTNRSWAQWRTYGQDANSTYNTNAPTFVDEDGAAGTDHALQVGSDGIDDGTTIILADPDYSGVSRPQGSAYDIGAFEYKVASSTTKKIRVIIIK